MKSDILKQKNISEYIISELSTLDVEIPNSGFLAGGAVSNMLMRLVWEDDAYPINDLDIFAESEQDLFDVVVSTPLRTNELIVEGDGYMVTKLSYDHGSNYKIIDVERDGLLNIIHITKVSNRENRNDYQYILNGFDFNCCQVGIDLSTNKLYYTEGFENFLNYRQLVVTAVYTPAHTAIRLFKKMDELKCYCDVDSCMELLSQPLIPQNSVSLPMSHFGIYFSVKYKEMYLKYYRKLKEYFKMVRFFDHKKILFEESSSVGTPPLVIPNNHGLQWLEKDNSIPTELLDSWAKYNDIMWTLLPKKFDKPNELLQKILVGVNYNPLTFINSFNIINGKTNKKLRAKAEKVVMNNYYLCKMVALTNNKFYDCDFDDSHLDCIENFVDKERWVLPFILKEKMNIQGSFELIKDIKKLYNREGEWISELLERYLSKKNKVFKPTYENMLIGLKKEKEKYSTDIITPLIINDFVTPKGVKIKELTSELDLRWAGNKLKNCINNPDQNYKEKIGSGRYKLFVIVSDNNMTAMELKLIEGTTYKVEQLLSYCNKVTSEFHSTVSNIFLNYLNMVHLKEIYDSKMKSYGSIDILNRGLLINLKDEKTDGNPTGPIYINVRTPVLGGDVEIPEGEIEETTDWEDPFAITDDIDDDFNW
jgi:hypothetical protein